MTPRSPVPQEVATELQRVVRRWRELPLDHALSCAPRVRALLDELATQSAGADRGSGPRGIPVPDLGPAVLMDQLTVLVYDTCAADWTPATHTALATRLTDLRRELA